MMLTKRLVDLDNIERFEHVGIVNRSGMRLTIVVQ